MAHSGFWLRGARGKLAGACMQKGANGQTIMREVVIPKNPRTNGQLYQRAIMATVMRAYSAGKIIFDHSFEGKTVPAGNMHYFMKRNANLLRNYLASDLNDASNKFLGVAPETITPVPGLYMISEGSLIQNFFSTTEGTVDEISTPAPASQTETIGEYMTRVGITPGDVFTFCMFGLSAVDVAFEVDDSDNKASKQYVGKFACARLTVKTPADATAVAQGKKLGDLFEMDNVSNIRAAQLLESDLGVSVEITSAFSLTAGYYIKSYGIIRSRDDSGLRSTEYMHWYGEEIEESPIGISSDYILTAWKMGATKVGNSELILEGGNV